MDEDLPSREEEQQEDAPGPSRADNQGFLGQAPGIASLAVNEDSAGDNETSEIEHQSLPREPAPGLPLETNEWRQRSLREFSLRRTEATSTLRPSRSSSSAAASDLHQSQLRKQTRAVAPAFSPAANSRLSVAHPGAVRSSSLGSIVANVPARPVEAPRFAAIEMPSAVRYERSVSVPVVSSSSAHNIAPCSSPIHGGSGWSEVESTGGAPPCERSLHTAAVLNGCMFVFGGYTGTARVNDFHSYSFAEKRWSPVLPSATSGPAPSPRDRHVSVTYGNSFYVQGGFDGTSRVSDFFAFDFSSMTWREVVPSSGRPPSPRHSHAAIVWRHFLLIYGGYDGSYKSDLHEFDFNSRTWSQVPAAGRRPRARYRATCVVHKNKMILFGGHDGTRHLADTHVFDLEARIWSALVTEGTPPIPRDSHISVVHGNQMYTFGGSTGAAMNDLHELQLPADSTLPAKWRPIKFCGGTEPSPRFCHIGVVYGDALYCFGGYDSAERLNDFIKFDFAVYDLSFEVPPSTLISDLRAMVNDETLSDVTFIVEEQPVHAHKLILLRSSYFRALFLGPMRESTQSTIRIEQVSYPIFLVVLEYLYTDYISIPLEIAMELFEAADLFCIPRLKTMCEKRMLQSITVENAATIFHAADLHMATALRRKALKYIVSHFEDVSKTQAFEEMGRCNMELIFEVLRNR